MKRENQKESSVNPKENHLNSPDSNIRHFQTNKDPQTHSSILSKLQQVLFK